MYFNNMKYISRFLFMQAFFPFFVEEKLIFVITRVRDKDCVKNRVKRAKIVRFTLC